MFEQLSASFKRIVGALGGRATISERNIQEAVESIKRALLDADVHVRVVRRFVNQTIQHAQGQTVLASVSPAQQFIKIVHERLTAFLGEHTRSLHLKGPDTQSIILLLGLQGSGKTTSAAKLAAYLKDAGRSPLLAACDHVRAAASAQLAVLGTHIGVPVYQHALPHEQQPCALDTARGALQYARSHGNDVLIIDTAGRLHVDAALMQELILLKETLVPVETLLVADALTGQTVVRIAEEFHAAVGISGVVLSKFDSDTRGGAALSLKSITGQPLLFVGTGERPQDFEPFHPERAAGRILGMGDIVSLVEKAQKAFDAQEHARAQKKTQSHERFTLSDMLDHLQTIEKMGPLHSLVEMIPGLAVAVSADALDARAFKRQKAIIQSMTVQERDNFLIIGPSRRRRIAAGSGTSVADVNRLIKNFERMRDRKSVV